MHTTFIITFIIREKYICENKTIIVIYKKGEFHIDDSFFFIIAGRQRTVY